MALRIEGQIHTVLEATLKAGAAKMGGVVRCKLQNVITGRFSEPHFRPDERLENVELERQQMEYLFSDESNCVLMNPISFEQVELPRALVGPGEKFLEPGMTIPVKFCEGRPVNLVLPEFVEARIADTAPTMHAQQDSTWKKAKLENGVEIMVPLFIGPGDVVRVKVSTGTYQERARSEKRGGV
jgi:elongation factor P